MRVFALIVAMIIIASLSIKIQELNDRLYQAGFDLESCDDYWSSVMQDYQVVVTNDSLYLLDDDRLVGTVKIDYDNSALGTLIREDNR